MFAALSANRCGVNFLKAADRPHQAWYDLPLLSSLHDWASHPVVTVRAPDYFPWCSSDTVNFLRP